MAELWPQHQPIVLPNRTIEASFAEFIRRISFTGVNSYTLLATDDAGDGTVEGDVNATDFTGQGEPPATNTFKIISREDVVGIIHKVVLYQYVGPQNVSIGIGGDRTTVEADYIAIGTADHALLLNLTVGDPHPQYTLAASAQAVFIGAGYGGVLLNTPTGIADLGAGFIGVPYDSTSIASPVLITQDTANNGIIFLTEGVWSVNVLIALSHDEQNSTREFNIRLRNVTTATTDFIIPIGIGRDIGVTNWSATLLVEVTAAQEGDLYTIEIGGGDAVASVTVKASSFTATHSSEFQGVL